MLLTVIGVAVGEREDVFQSYGRPTQWNPHGPPPPASFPPSHVQRHACLLQPWRSAHTSSQLGCVGKQVLCRQLTGAARQSIQHPALLNPGGHEPHRLLHSLQSAHETVQPEPWWGMTDSSMPAVDTLTPP